MDQQRAVVAQIRADAAMDARAQREVDRGASRIAGDGEAGAAAELEAIAPAKCLAECREEVALAVETVDEPQRRFATEAQLTEPLDARRQLEHRRRRAIDDRDTAAEAERVARATAAVGTALQDQLLGVVLAFVVARRDGGRRRWHRSR